MEAFAMRSRGTDESTGNEPHAITGSQNNVVGHSSEYGLAMNHQVSIADGDVRRDRHFRAPKNCYQQTEFHINNKHNKQNRPLQQIKFTTRKHFQRQRVQ